MSDAPQQAAGPRTKEHEDAVLRESLGMEVRAEWIAWAKEQPNPKPSWLVEWDGLTEPDREVDRRIGERLFRAGMHFSSKQMLDLQAASEAVGKSHAEGLVLMRNAHNEIDLLRMQAAAVMTASIQNTETSIKDRIGRDSPYWTQCYADVCAAVDREMKLRAATGFCERHAPTGGTRNCIICGIERQHAALGRIASICEGEPEITAFDVHCNEGDVVKQVKALRAERDALVKERDELAGSAINFLCALETALRAASAGHHNYGLIQNSAIFRGQIQRDRAARSSGGKRTTP